MSFPPSIVVIVGNPTSRSRTKVLAQAITARLTEALQGLPHRLQVHEMVTLAPQIGVANTVADLPPEGAAVLRAIETADLLIAVTPVYKGSYTGLFKHLFDLVNPEALVGRPVLLAANGGSDRHALVVDHQLRPLFAFFRALTVPSAVYAAESDFDGYNGIRSEALQGRVAEAVDQAVALLLARQQQAVVTEPRLVA